MTEFKMDMNPFDSSVKDNFTEAQIQELFQQSQEGNGEAKKQILAWGSKLVEDIILQLQPFNVPEKFTFTALCEIGMAELTKRMEHETYDQYRRFSAWCIRQALRKALVEKN
jgi:hypothetical protein